MYRVRKKGMKRWKDVQAFDSTEAAKNFVEEGSQADQEIVEVEGHGMFKVTLHMEPEWTAIIMTTKGKATNGN